jgi:hypothetical protein
MLNRNHTKLTPELKEVQILINQIKQKIRWKTKLATSATTFSLSLKN